jgi:hypothetical protein
MNWIRSGREMVAWVKGSCCGVQGFGQTRVQGTGFVGKGWVEGPFTCACIQGEWTAMEGWYFSHLMECKSLGFLLYFFIIFV